MVKHKGALDATFAALADPTRRAILARLARRAASVTELAGPFDLSLPAVSKHLRVLERAGLIAREKEGRVHRCSLVARPMRDAAGWIARYRRFWEARFDALARYLDDTAQEEEPRWPDRPRAPTPRSASPAASRPRATRSSGPGRTRRR